MSFYIDETNELDLNAIKQLSPNQFTALKGEDFRHDLTEHAIWFKLNLKSDLSQAQEFIIEFTDPSIWSITLYQVNADTTLVSQTGVGLFQKEKAVKGNRNNFRITLIPHQTNQLYFKVNSKTSITISASMHHADTTYERYLNEHTILGVYYGIVLLLILYSWLLFLATRFRTFLLYGLYVLSVAAFTSIADGFNSKYFSNLVLFFDGYHDIFFFAATNILALLFMADFLKIRSWNKGFFRVVIITCFVLAISVVTTFLISKPLMLQVVQFLGLITLVMFITGGIMAVVKKVDQAVYYLLAYIAFGMFIFIFLLSQYRVIAFSTLVQYSLHIGYALSMITLSYGLSQRIYSIYKELLVKEKEKKQIIEEKNIELEHKVEERTAYIAEKEINLRSILDNNDNSIWLIDRDYQLIDFNRIFGRLWENTYGTTLETGQNILEMMPIEELRKKWKERYDYGLEGNVDTYIDNYLIEGNQHYYEIRGFPIEEAGQVKGVAFFSKDISSRLKAEKQLKTQNEMLKKVNKELDSFVYSASHDLKAPLASVLGLINLVREETDLKSRLKLYGMMERSIIRLDTFIKDIIDYSRNERTEIKHTSIDLKKMIKNIFTDMKYLDGVNQIKKNIDVEEQSSFKSDALRVRIAVRNLISNAIKYGCSEDAKQKQIDVYVVINQNEATIKIKDFGPGIPEKHHPHIYEMFYKAHEKSSGTGLGLYIVKETVEKLQGGITFESKKNKGTTFTLNFPNNI